MKYLCPSCRGPLNREDDRLVCQPCGTGHAHVVDGMVEFDGCTMEESFFEKQARERLDALYSEYTPEAFKDALRRVELWQMDWANKRVGIARKFWWEPHLGHITGKRVMEVGCGVNYIVPSLLATGNDVFAFDFCKGSVDFLRKILARMGVPTDRLELAVADATKLEMDEKFDLIDINNVLHHIPDKRAALERVRRHLKDDGKLILVEPNYFYPPRWMIETEVLDPFNVIKDYFVRNDLIEKGEKGVIFPELHSLLRESGFKVETTFADPNHLGYFTQYWIREDTMLARAIFALDKYLFRHLVPNAIAPFHYIIASKA